MARQKRKAGKSEGNPKRVRALKRRAAARVEESERRAEPVRPPEEPTGAVRVVNDNTVPGGFRLERV